MESLVLVILVILHAEQQLLVGTRRISHTRSLVPMSETNR